MVPKASWKHHLLDQQFWVTTTEMAIVWWQNHVLNSKPSMCVSLKETPTNNTLKHQNQMFKTLGVFIQIGGNLLYIYIYQQMLIKSGGGWFLKNQLININYMIHLSTIYIYTFINTIYIHLSTIYIYIYQLYIYTRWCPQDS